MQSAEYPDLIASLEARSTGKRVGRAYKKDCSVWGIPELTITRWKFNEFDYYSDKANLPIKARGLFTMGNRILVRGYDKFFNTGEVKVTKPDALESNTSGPFYATVKENGYLVLISAYKKKLVVTSKNSSGPDAVNEVGRNYSEVARNWVFKHLESVGKTEEEFAEFLEENNWTAVGEVCDDSFEEHVLPYPPDIAGIYLNGLNKNSITLCTEPPSKVLEASERFGFRRTEYLEFQTFEELMAFLEGSEKTGKWHDREVEGFVIRCKRSVKPVSGKPVNEESTGEMPANEEHAEPSENSKDSDESVTVVDFFWKFKFEEPYLMYREWREVVKTYLESGPMPAFARAKRSRHSVSCLQFLAFARRWLEEYPELKKRLQLYNLGIIELRSNFFKHGDMTDEALLGLDLKNPRWLLVTVATIGCGKSTVSAALTYLFKDKWAHKQNDSVGPAGKGGKFGKLVSQLTNSFSDSDVAILDKNNSAKDERQKIFESFDSVAMSIGYDLKYVCLNFLPEGPDKSTAQLTRDRVIARGDNHQTIKLSHLSPKGINSVMAQFEKRYDVVNPASEPDSQFDLVIDLVPGESARNVRRILDALKDRYEDLEIPDFKDSEIENAIDYVRRSEAEVSAVAASSSTRPKHKLAVSYFGVRISQPNYDFLVKYARSIVSEQHDSDVFDRIKIQDTFHVTLAHYRSHREMFNKLKQQYKKAITESGEIMLGTTASLKIIKLSWNDRIMAFEVIMDNSANKHPHITVGAAEGVPAVEASTLFDGRAKDVNTVQLPGDIELKGQELYAFVKNLS